MAGVTLNAAPGCVRVTRASAAATLLCLITITVIVTLAGLSIYPGVAAALLRAR